MCLEILIDASHLLLGKTLKQFVAGFVVEFVLAAQRHPTHIKIGIGKHELALIDLIEKEPVTIHSLVEAALKQFFGLRSESAKSKNAK